jgi:hypothetical protein
LKRPPEIWELVQPVAPNQSAGYPFIKRFASSRPILIVVIVALISAAGYFGIQSVKLIAGGVTDPVDIARPVDSSKTVATEQKPTQQSVPAPVAAASIDQTTALIETVKPRRKVPQRSKPTGSVTEVGNRSAVGETVSSPEASGVSVPGNQKLRPPANSAETVGSRSFDSPSHSKSKTSLSPQLIDSSKTQPRKSKVIQWP